MRNIDYTVHLLKGYLKGDITGKDYEELQKILKEYPDLLEFVEKLEAEKGLRDALEEYLSLDSDEKDEEQDEMLQGILTTIRKENTFRKVYHPYFIQVAKVASVAVLFFVMVYALRDRFVGEGDPIEMASTFKAGTNKAVLKTSDGRTLELSSEYEGIVMGEEIAYTDGSVLLDGEDDQQNLELTLSTPRGGQYQVLLPDGTKVWLNADTKLTYPKTFSGGRRTVHIVGEAYFEVKPGMLPFIVYTGKERVEVLGTHFNINSYTDEPISFVSLLEGKVKVSLDEKEIKILKPGQQSVVKENAAMQVQTIDVSETIAWKNGEFMFNNERISSVMRKLARWYDIEIEVAPSVQNISIWGSISRYESLSEILQIIKMTDESIQFKVEGRRVRLMK